ncbi:MAG: arylsulfatase, partial [Prosthecobacter sp.]|nr:arylsulfatase [Prosthecobacter sp.]
GTWKLVAKGPQGEWELYDMEHDRTEQHDLASQHPDRVKTMSEQWLTYAKRAQVIPWIWGLPYGDPLPAKKGKNAKKKDH